MNWTPQELALPDLPDGYSWKLVLDTDDRGMKPESKPKTGTRSKEKEPENNVFTELLADRSTRIYMSVQSKKQTKKKSFERYLQHFHDLLIQEKQQEREIDKLQDMIILFNASQDGILNDDYRSEGKCNEVLERYKSENPYLEQIENIQNQYKLSHVFV